MYRDFFSGRKQFLSDEDFGQEQDMPVQRQLKTNCHDKGQGSSGEGQKNINDKNSRNLIKNQDIES